MFLLHLREHHSQFFPYVRRVVGRRESYVHVKVAERRCPGGPPGPATLDRAKVDCWLRPHEGVTGLVVGDPLFKFIYYAVHLLDNVGDSGCMPCVHQASFEANPEPAASTVSSHEPQARGFPKDGEVCSSSMGHKVRGTMAVAPVLGAAV